MRILSMSEIAIAKLSVTEPKFWLRLVNFDSLHRPGQYLNTSLMDEVEYVGMTVEGYDEEGVNVGNYRGCDSGLGRLISVWTWTEVTRTDENYFVVGYSTGIHTQLAYRRFNSRAERQEFLDQDQPFVDHTKFHFYHL
ncbi:hypothetical protein D3C87_587920 [compost metagenome]